MTQYLVTGGAGFIGSHLVHRLVADGQKVRVLDNFATGKKANLADVMDKIELVEGDLRVPADCGRACKGVEIIFHEAALPSVPKSVADPLSTHDVNINGTFNILIAARDCGCRRLIYAASSSAYGDQLESPKRESMRPAPLSPYALHKLVGEYYLSVFHKCYSLETLALRYFNVFGPRQDPKSQYAAAIPAFVASILNDEPPTIYGDGEQTRDFTFIDNVVHGNMLAAKAPKACGEAINVACAESVTINRTIQLINELLGKNVKPVYTDVRPGDVKHSLADITLARKIIGFEPIVSFADGLRQAIQWYRENL
jgi:nucleoside-diphosphate-sugar epimerase